MISSLDIIDSGRIQNKIQVIHKLVKGKKVIVAFSGGVDSSVLASLVSDVADSTILVMQVGLSVGIGEKEFATRQSEQLGLPLHFLEYEEYLESEEYRQNPDDRCYHCKNLLHSKLEDYRVKLGYDFVVNGTNYSDLSGHRPGYRAILERQARTPFVEARLTKPEIRWIAAERGLYSASKPATPCVASRIQTGIAINEVVLDIVRRGEAIIRKNFDFRIFRLRYRTEGLVLELGDEDYESATSDVISRLQELLTAEGVTSSLHPQIQRYRPSGATNAFGRPSGI